MEAFENEIYDSQEIEHANVRKMEDSLLNLLSIKKVTDDIGKFLQKHHDMVIFKPANGRCTEFLAVVEEKCTSV